MAIEALLVPQHRLLLWPQRIPMAMAPVPYLQLSGVELRALMAADLFRLLHPALLTYILVALLVPIAVSWLLLHPP